MSGEVIEFPRRRETMAGRDPRQQQVELERQRSERITRVQDAAVDPKRKFDRRDDEIWPAQAVDRLIAEAKAIKITQLDIIEALSKRNLPVRHLERLRVDHRLAPSEARKKAPDNLIRKVQPYVITLETLANLLERSPGEVIYDAFRETHFWQTATVSVGDPASDLCWLIQEMARHVMRLEKLGPYFQEASTVSCEYHPGLGARAWGEWGSPESPVHYEGVDMPADFAPRFPTVPLLRVRRASFFGTIQVERETVAPPDYSPVQADAALTTACPIGSPGPLALADTFECAAALFMDIDLVIGPKKWTGALRENDLVAMFQTRWHGGELTIGNQACALIDASELLPLDSPLDVDAGGFKKCNLAARFADGWRRVTGMRLGEYAETAGFPDVFIGSNQVWYKEIINFPPADAATVHQLMEFLSQSNQVYPAAHIGRDPHWLCELIGPETKPTEFRYEGERCREFEMALYTGAIETALAEDCRLLKARLAQRIAERKATLERETQSDEVKLVAHAYIEDLADRWGLAVERETRKDYWFVRNPNGKIIRAEQLLGRFDDWRDAIEKFISALKIVLEPKNKAEWPIHIH